MKDTMTRGRPEKLRCQTAALFLPFDLFGSGGTARGAEQLADAFREMLGDNKRERKATRARAYTNRVRIEEFSFKTPADYHTWRADARQAILHALQEREFLLWVSGNHLGVLPVYEALGPDTLILQLDAHLDIYHLSDCTEELCHGNFLLHAEEPLPGIMNLGSRELLLPPEHVGKYYRQVFAAEELAVAPEAVLREIRQACAEAKSLFLDIDCDVFDPAFFPAVTNPLPFGIDPRMLLRLVDAAWSEKVAGLALSEFDPARDINDRSLATLLWLLEFVLLKRHEGTKSG
jgi:arginase family enzyme